MAELQRFIIDVRNENQESDSVVIRLERDTDRYTAQGEHGGALMAQCEGHTAVEALTSCLQQVGVVDDTRRIVGLRQEGDSLVSEAEFDKSCRDVGITVSD
ncbi:hypothetical protein [Modicisalibacter xianhensis]|uniref:Uncharacterized protein n=1 Tax=Modicisalibacter xianhensis TaxID=442341 RepID=A0A1I2YZN9_9GAMM|nr:hypothetical protein [Halomonas xianhensis]SFH31053.1 hypothetical protein SAMN04487959_102270 [Halomonas xianhensis]